MGPGNPEKYLKFSQAFSRTGMSLKCQEVLENPRNL